ncbi:hypothetical protein B0H11DRAFT_2183267 [Mycena galericulata]|nr:hypothetical protein B0H11DRAFT_2183267 [Mycena galericulata]
MTYYDGLTIQFTLARGRKLSWMNELRKGLYPGQIPVHVTIFPVFSADEDEHSALFERLEEVAALFEPLWEEDGEGDAFGEIVEELKDWCAPTKCSGWKLKDQHRVPVDAVEEPHITMYRGPKSGAYIPYFDEWMGTAGIRRRLERLVDEYAAEHGGNGLSVRVTGLQLLHDGEVVDMRVFAMEESINGKKRHLRRGGCVWDRKYGLDPSAEGPRNEVGDGALTQLQNTRHAIPPSGTHSSICPSPLYAHETKTPHSNAHQPCRKRGRGIAHEDLDALDIVDIACIRPDLAHRSVMNYLKSVLLLAYSQCGSDITR